MIVDDGSCDHTLKIVEQHAERMPITFAVHHINKGLGPTIHDALKKASEMADDQDIIFSMDADNTHPAELMIPMVKKIEEGFDLVIASRYRPGAAVVGLSGLRRLMSIGARILFQILFPIPGVRDYTCGYRAYRASLLKRAFSVYGDTFIEHRDFQAMADILLKLRHCGVAMTEVPMVLRYDRKRGASSMRVGTTVLHTLGLLVKRCLEEISHRSASVHKTNN